MDPLVSGALTAARLSEPAERERWFDTLCRTYRALCGEGEPDWSILAERLRDEASAEGVQGVAETFIDYLNSYASSPVAVVTELAKIGDDLPLLYQELAGAEGSAAVESGYDEAAWYEFLAEHGPSWNGSEAAWGPFVEWFRYHAAERRFSEPAERFLEYMNAHDDKVAAFAVYGVTIAAAPAEDEGFGWVPEQHRGELAQAWGGDWESLLETQLTARWGEGWQANPAEHKAAWLEDLLPSLLAADDAAEAAPDISPDEVANAALQEAIAEIPGAESLSPEELADLLAEITAELGGQPA